MKYLEKSVLTSIIMVIFLSFSAFAGEVDIPVDVTNATEVASLALEENVENGKVRVDGSVRGEWLAEVVLQISNLQNGNIGVLMVTNCYTEVDRILMGLYVDKVTDDNNWSQVDYKVFEFLPEDFSDGKLMDAIIDIEITGHEPGWYRLRGVYLVEKGDNSEFYSAETGGIEITDRFPLSAVEATPSEVISDEAGQ